VTRYASIGLLVALLSFDRVYAQTSPVMELLAQAKALTPDAAHGRILYLKHCTGCHGKHAWGDGPKAIPALAGQREFYLIEQLAQFTTHERNNALMSESTHPADVNRPQAFRDVAAYLAQAMRNPRADHEEGSPTSAGAKIYARGCAVCHGKSGAGSDSEPIPAIGGQHYEYLLLQLQNFAAGHRDRVDLPAVNFAAGLSPKEQQNVADYISRLTAMVATDASP
jgi:cytochrome c553